MNAIKNQNTERITLSVKPKLIITENLQKQIDFLHHKIGNLEWSGELITREEGSLNTPSEWIIIAENIYLADIGTAAHTEYEVGKGSWMPDDVMKMYEDFPELLEGTHKNQHCHSHNTMSTFFSSTDWGQMEDRSLTCNYLLMLIVNFDGKYCAKVGYRAKRKSAGDITLSLVNNTDAYQDVKVRGDVEKEVLVIMDCEMVYTENTLSTVFADRYKKVKEDKKTIITTFPSSKWAEDKNLKQGTLPLSTYGDNSWNEGWEYDPDTYEWKPKKGKAIMDMTEKEWDEFNKEKVRDFTRLEVFSFINALIDKAITINTKFPGDKLFNVSKRYNERIEFLERLETEGMDYFSSLFKSQDMREYISLLSAFKEYISPYAKGNTFYDELSTTIDEMIMDIMTELQITTD